MAGEFGRQVVTAVGTSDVDRATRFDEPLADPARWAVCLVLDDENRVGRHNAEATEGTQMTGSIRSRS